MRKNLLAVRLAAQQTLPEIRDENDKMRPGKQPPQFHKNGPIKNDRGPPQKEKHMPGLTIEKTGSGDMTWLGSTHGIRNARTEIIDVSKWSKATHFPDGFIKSGTPVAIVDGHAVPYNTKEDTTAGAGILAGFILTDQVITDENGTLGVPVFDHGRVITNKVPFENFTAPSAAKNCTAIVFQ